MGIAWGCGCRPFLGRVAADVETPSRSTEVGTCVVCPLRTEGAGGYLAGVKARAPSVAYLETHTARPRRRPLTERSRWQTWRRAASAERRSPTRIGTSIGTRRTTTSCRHCSEPCVTWRRARRDRFSSSRPRFAVRANDSGSVQRQDVRNSSWLAACPPTSQTSPTRRRPFVMPANQSRRKTRLACGLRRARLLS